MDHACVLLVGSTPSFVHTLGPILSEHGYRVVVKAWTDDLHSLLTDPPVVMVLDGSELPNLGWSLLGWLEHDPLTRYLPVLVCSDTRELLPYAMRALHRRPGPAIATSLDRDEFLAKFSTLQHLEWLLEHAP